MKLALLLALGATCAFADNWAVIVVGSKGYMNYRHHADGCHAYHIMKNGGIPESNIILMMQDDVANDRENPYPGKLFNKPTPAGTPGVDVYAGCKPTYTGDIVTGELFLDVIQGKTSGKATKVLKSTSKDNVFINFVDHGGTGIIAMPNGPYVKNTDLVSALQTMHSKNMYSKLVFYMEACESGSMFATLPKDINIYATTAANARESSWGTYCSPQDKVDGKSIGSCLGDLYSVNWMEDSDVKSEMASESLEKQFKLVTKETNKSHCQEFGDTSIASSPIHDFQAEESGVRQMQNVTAQPSTDDTTKLDSAVDSRDIALFTKFQNYLNSGSSDKAQALIEEITMREAAKAKFAKMAAMVAGNAHAERMLTETSELQGGEWTVHHTALDAVVRACGQFNDYTLKFTRVVANMVKAGSSAEQIAKAAQTVC
jgi:legumain